MEPGYSAGFLGSQVGSGSGAISPAPWHTSLVKEDHLLDLLFHLDLQASIAKDILLRK